ncbi:MAG: MFS transporter, partial [Bacilli bacterium]
TLVTLSNISVDSSKAFFILCQISMGIGMGTTMMAINTHVLQSAPRELVNRVTPLTSAAQQVMVSFATAGMVSFLTSRVNHYMGEIKNPADPQAGLQAMVDSFGDTFLLAAGIAVLGWLIAWTLNKPKMAMVTDEESKEVSGAMLVGH